MTPINEDRNHHLLALLSVLFVVALIAIVVFFVLPYLLAPPSDLGTQYLQKCPTTWPPDRPGPNTSQLETLAAMTVIPRNIATICVEYSADTDIPVTAILNSAIYFEANMSEVPSDLIQISNQPAMLRVPALRGESPSPVAYALFTLNASSNASGFYMISLDGVCPLMPLAVGYSQINYSDFAYGRHQRNQCDNPGFFGSYVSVGSVDVAYSTVPLNEQ